MSVSLGTGTLCPYSGRSNVFLTPSFFLFFFPFFLETKHTKSNNPFSHKIQEYTKRRGVRLLQWKWNMEEKTLHILFTRHVKKMFQSMSIGFINLVISGILNLHGPMREYSNYHKRTGPPRPKLPPEKDEGGSHTRAPFV